MCLPVSRLFWVSSLAYPNLLGTKGYVVVVVVVVVLFQTPSKWYAELAEIFISNDYYFLLWYYFLPVATH
jgi:hypothetical protein